MIRVATLVGARAVLLGDLIVTRLHEVGVLDLLQILIRVKVVHVVLEGRRRFRELAKVRQPLAAWLRLRQRLLMNENTWLLLLLAVRSRLWSETHCRRRWRSRGSDIMTRGVL